LEIFIISKSIQKNANLLAGSGPTLSRKNKTKIKYL